MVCGGILYILCSGTRRVYDEEEKLPRHGVATVTTSQHTRRPGEKKNINDRIPRAPPVQVLISGALLPPPPPPPTTADCPARPLTTVELSRIDGRMGAQLSPKWQMTARRTASVRSQRPHATK